MKAIAKVIKKITINSIVLFGLVTILSCSADDGKDGIDGIDGEVGTANVIYSGWVNAPAGTAEIIDGTAGLSTIISVPKLTSDILNNGVVLVYMKFGSGVHVFPLPYTSTAGGFANTITAIPILNNIKIFRFKHAADGTTVGLPASLSYRYILIPGGVPATDGKSVKIDYSKMSYEDVCARLNIKP